MVYLQLRICNRGNSIMIHLEEFVKRQIETKISRILCPLTAILPPDFSGGRTCIQSIKEKSCGHIQIIFPAVSRIPLPDCGFERRSVGAGGGNGFQFLQVANLSYSYLSVTIGQLPVGNCRVFSRDSGFCREEKFCYLSGWTWGRRKNFSGVLTPPWKIQ